MDENNEQKQTMLYSRKGELLYVRLFSTSGLPRAERFYCAQEECEGKGKIYKKGELTRVNFHASLEEIYYFNPDGSFDYKTPKQ